METDEELEKLMNKFYKELEETILELLNLPNDISEVQIDMRLKLIKFMLLVKRDVELKKTLPNELNIEFFENKKKLLEKMKKA